MRQSPEPANGAYYDPAWHNSVCDNDQSDRLREPYWHTDANPDADGNIYRDPIANFHAFANTAAIKLGLNPAPYIGKCHAYTDGTRTY